ncbi:MAG: hypothetical protein FWC44_02205 [Methanomassiliicoccaceae archaeon]|nr:hypothetical protein [Methanomassiliicoccaceae archaeon]
MAEKKTHNRNRCRRKIPINRQHILHTMALFGKGEQVFKKEGLILGEFDPTVDGFYKNVQSFPFKVKKRKVLEITIDSDIPVDVAIANEKGMSIIHKQGIKSSVIGPIPTDDNKEMGIILGVYPGDKATVNAEIWMEKQ